MFDIITTNPATEEIVGRYKAMSEAEVSKLIDSVHAAYEEWKKTDIASRIKLLLNAAKIIREDKDFHAKLMSEEMGKPITQGLGEIEACAQIFEFYANNAEKFMAPEVIESEFYKSYRSFQPTGITFGIMPWNYPYQVVLRYAIPNMLLGNAAFLKHAPNCIGIGLAIEKLFIKAGFPENLFKCALVDVDLAEYIIAHEKVTGIALTGSNRAGQAVASQAGAVVKKCIMELGGSDPHVVLSDADVDQAVDLCIKQRLGNCGQTCVSAKRLIVVDSLKEEFTQKIIERTKAYVAGDPLDPKTNLGPMARGDLRDQLHDQVMCAIKSGAKCVLGGEVPQGKGYFYPATVLLEVKEDSPAFQEELFGPVVCIVNAKNDEEAIRLANETPYGLGATVYTRDVEKGEKLARDVMQAGICTVNTTINSMGPQFPFGGIKQSGFGRELSLEGLREFANIKSVIVNK